MTKPIKIDPAYEGPPGSANGGYSCGVLAAHLDGDAEITLRRPVPLGTPLRVAPRDGGVLLLDGDETIAEGAPVRLEDNSPKAPAFADALTATASFPGLGFHPYPKCVGCGTARTDARALRIFPGPIEERKLLAAVWYPGGPIGPAEAWAALDCPGGWAAMHFGRTERPAVLGRMAAHLSLPEDPQSAYIVVGWLESVDGRKLTAGTALYSRDGTPHGFSRQTWITLR
ncbi:hypothetical protein [Paractinoplanes globisporus]|uniref:Uncharacterized protein n=1 Tax=Paractinoplanes globisporus TaxID=113565 RepID=A0ABW6WAA8_9ACTN|nr:hypothetical protein [Actinoplanes globisporus]